MHIGTTVTSPAGSLEAAVVMDGREQPLYRRLFDGKVFVAGQPGRVYTLRVRNLVGNRIEIINTVDGRNTLKDEAGDANANRGLVFNGHQSGEFRGWRINNQETREFVFGAPEHSITAQATGSAANVGVIGFAVHQEHHYGGVRPRGSAGLRGGGYERGIPSELESGPPQMMGLRGGLGTGMGELQQDRVGSTPFTRSSTQQPDILVIGYDLEDVLREQGIIAPAEPNAFPGANTGYDRYRPMQG